MQPRVPGRVAPAQAAQAEKAERAEALAKQVTVSQPPAPVGQRVVSGYRLTHSFSDVRHTPWPVHRIIPKGTTITDKREVERLARAGAQMEVVEAPQAAE